MNPNSHTQISPRLIRAGALIIIAVCAVMISVPDRAHAARPAETVWAPHFKRSLRVIRPRTLGRVLATWYGPGLWGNRTACGKPLRRKAWGIAHRTLPCGKMVALRYRGRKIAVPVIDRGPYSGADIDLTQRTAEYLGLTRDGVGQVHVRVLKRRVATSKL